MDAAREDYKKPSIIAIFALTVLLIGAFVYYKERIFFEDASYIAFCIINNKSMCIQEHRYGSFITHIVPFLGQKLHLPLKTILVSYSVSFNFFYLSVASVIVFLLKQYRLAILMALYYFLMVSDSYFWTNNEVHQGIAWMFLFFAVTLYLGNKKINILLFLVPFLLLGFLSISSHYIVIIPLGFLWGYFIMEKTNWPFSNKKTVLLSFLLAGIIILKFAIGHSDSYDGNDLNGIYEASIKDVFGSFSSQVVSIFLHRCLVNYWIAIMVFFISIFTLIKSNKITLLAWMVISCIGYIIFMGIVFRKNGGYLPFLYVETEWQSLSIIFTAPFVFTFLQKLKPSMPPLVLTVIFITRLAYIGTAIPAFSWREDYKERTMTQMKKKGLTKLALYADEYYPRFIPDWAMPCETLLESAMDGDKPQLTFCFVDRGDTAYIKNLKKSDCFSVLGQTMPVSMLNNEYFQIDSTNLYKIMPYVDLDTAFGIIKYPAFFNEFAHSDIAGKSIIRTIDYTYFEPAEAIGDQDKLIAICSTQVISKPIFLQKGKYAITVLSYGTPVRHIFPHNNIYVNGMKTGDFISHATLGLSSFNFELERDTTIKIKIDMDNDASTKNEDRNTFIKNICVFK